jgi:hypothetical protein
MISFEAKMSSSVAPVRMLTASVMLGSGGLRLALAAFLNQTA